MASDKGYLEYVLEQLSELEDISYRAMMGEYVIYYRGRIAGGIYDNRFLVKPVSSALEYVQSPKFAVPYEGAKPMLEVDNIDDSGYLCGLLRAMYDELPEAKKKKKQ